MTSPRLEIAREPVQGACIIRLKGTLDENFDPRSLEGLPAVVVFDMDRVSRITSYGLRQWMIALERLDCGYYCFVRARPSMVINFNMVHNFGGAGQLISLYAPFLCDGCDKSFDVLFDLRRDYGLVVAATPPRAFCPLCGQPAEFDDIPSIYFRYCASRPPPRPPDAVLSALDGDVSPDRTFKIAKEVVAWVTALWMSGELDERVRFTRIADGFEGDVLMVLATLEATSRPGLARFVEFSRSPGFRLHAARVPTGFLASLMHGGYLGRDGNGLPFAVVSANVVAECPTCSTRSEHELDLQRRGWLESGPSCPVCRVPTNILMPLALREALARLPVAAVPPAIAQYLQRRPGAELPTEGLVEDGSSAPAGPAIPFGKYQLVRRLGVGGMAEVFLARQIGPDNFRRNVALKRLRPHLTSDQGFVDMFMQEARIVTSLSHPNIVQIFEFGRIAGQYYLAMEYVRGIDLGMCLRALGALDILMPIEIACFIVQQTCAGLSAAHSLRDDAGKATPVVHRDVSPQNILLSSDGFVKVADFGIAKASDSQTHTEHGAIKGKFGYIAPERIDGTANPHDVRSDVFSVGAILHECLTGRGLFRRENELATIRAVLAAPIARVGDSRPDAGDGELDRIIQRALTRDLSRRFQSASELEATLERYLTSSGRSVSSAQLAQWLKTLIEEARIQKFAGLPDPSQESDPDGDWTPTVVEDRKREN